MKTKNTYIDKRESLELSAKVLENRRKAMDISETQKERQLREKRAIMDELSQLKDLAGIQIIDEEKTLFAKEPFYKPLLNRNEINDLKKRIWNLLDKL